MRLLDELHGPGPQRNSQYSLCENVVATKLTACLLYTPLASLVERSRVRDDNAMLITTIVLLRANPVILVVLLRAALVSTTSSQDVADLSSKGLARDLDLVLGFVVEPEARVVGAGPAATGVGWTGEHAISHVVLEVEDAAPDDAAVGDS